jgi:hypothetical protein
MTRETSLLTPEVHREIVSLVAGGCGLPTAAAAAGAAPDTVSEWVRRGEGFDKRPPAARYVAFARDVRLAQALCEAHAARSALRSRDWRAAAWWLAARFPERWGTGPNVSVGRGTR